MTDLRKRQIESINKTSDRITELAHRFDNLRWMAEQPHRSDAFVNLACAAGELIEASLEQLATLLEILFNAGTKVEANP